MQDLDYERDRFAIHLEDCLGSLSRESRRTLALRRLTQERAVDGGEIRAAARKIQ